MRNLQKAGAFAALLNASIGIADMIIVFGVLGAEATYDPALVAERVRIQPFPLVLLEIFKFLSAVAALFVVLAIHQRLKHVSPRGIQLATLAGVVSVFLLLTAGTLGMIAIALANLAGGAGPGVDLPAYLTYSAIITRMGSAAVFANGLWYLFVGFTAIRTGLLPRKLGYVAVSLGVTSLIIFVLPPVALLVLVLGLTWSVWLAVFLLRTALPGRINRTKMIGDIQMKKQLKRNTRPLLIGAFSLAILLALSWEVIQRTGGLEQFTGTDYFPTQGWQSSTPEEQGFDSVSLADGLTTIKKNGTLIHSLMIVRHGSIIVDATFYPYNRSTYHDVASVTKSVMTTLIAIAADQGKLDLDQPVVSFFPGRTIANLDTRKEHLTIRNLVSMSSGLDCTAEAGEKTLEEMKDSADWLQFVLDRKVIYDPGTHFEYCSPGMYLLSAILQRATGMTALEYAKINLFEPLGIRDVYWPSDPQGYNHGWGDLALYPQDMAKIGYLLLHQGRWEGKQIVSREWIRQATQRQIETGTSEDDDYGYGWWVSRPDSEIEYYMARGRGGQYIIVVPSMDMVLVTTGGGYDFADIEEYIKAAIGDLEKPLPGNPIGVEHLKAVVAGLALPPTAHAVPPLPETADAISGQVFVLEQPNPLEMRSVQLDFGDSAEAILRVNKVNGAESRLVRVGLDGVYRSSQWSSPIIARGEWSDDETFVIDYDEGFTLDTYIISMRFNANHLLIEVDDISHASKLSIEGQALGKTK